MYLWRGRLFYAVLVRCPTGECVLTCMQIGGRDYDGAAAYLLKEARHIQRLASGRSDITVEVQHSSLLHHSAF